MSDFINFHSILYGEEMNKLNLCEDEQYDIIVEDADDMSYDSSVVSEVDASHDLAASHDELRKKKNRDAAKRARDKNNQKEKTLAKELLNQRAAQVKFKYQLVQEANELKKLIDIAQMHKLRCGVDFDIGIPRLPPDIAKLQGVPDLDALCSGRKDSSTNDGARKRSNNSLEHGGRCAADDKVKIKLRKIIQGMDKAPKSCMPGRVAMSNPSIVSETTSSIGDQVTVINGGRPQNLVSSQRIPQRSLASSTVTRPTTSHPPVHVEKPPNESKLLSLVQRIKNRPNSIIPSTVNDIASSSNGEERASLPLISSTSKSEPSSNNTALNISKHPPQTSCYYPQNAPQIPVQLSSNPSIPSWHLLDTSITETATVSQDVYNKEQLIASILQQPEQAPCSTLQTAIGPQPILKYITEPLQYDETGQLIQDSFDSTCFNQEQFNYSTNDVESFSELIADGMQSLNDSEPFHF